MSVAKKRAVLIIIMGAVIAITAFSVGYTPAPKNDPQNVLPSPATPISQNCRKDDDCALGIRLDECCNCPEITTRQTIKLNKNIAEYTPGKDYSTLKTVNCSNIICEPCESIRGVSCLDGQCRPL